MIKDCYGCELSRQEQKALDKEDWCICDDSKHKHCPDCDGMRDYDRSYVP